MTPATHPIPTDEPQPAWAIAELFPPQGQWSEEEYLAATDSTNRLVELVDGWIEVLPMPTIKHQLVIAFFYRLLYEFVSRQKLGVVLTAGVRVRTRKENFREPDVLFMPADRFDPTQDRYWENVGLAVEVVSPDPQSHERDWTIKRQEYARAGIAEYWIVDPQEKRAVVLKLEGGCYVEHAAATETGPLRSALLQGLSVEAADIWAAMNG